MSARVLTKSRTRRCGCDCKDVVLGPCADFVKGGGYGYGAPVTADCCDVCRDQNQQPPCVYVADFGCVLRYQTDTGYGNNYGSYGGYGGEHNYISIVEGSIDLRHNDYFSPTSKCKWIGLGETPGCSFGAVGGVGAGFCFSPEATGGSWGYAFPNNKPEHCCISLCTWAEIYYMYGDGLHAPITTVFGTSWELEITASGATFSWDHPILGLLSYAKFTEWVCDDLNTMTLTSEGNLPEGFMPKHICIKPYFGTGFNGSMYDCKLNPTIQGQEVLSDPQITKCWDDCEDVSYDAPEHRCACCDACQPCAYVYCGSTLYQFTRPGTGPDPVGINSAQQAFKGGSFTSGFGGVLYCDGETPKWQLDTYCDGEYLGTSEDPDFTCVDNVMYFQFSPDFEVPCCVSDPPPTCDCLTLQTDLPTVTVSSSGGSSATLSFGGASWSALTSIDSLAVTPAFTCVTATSYTLTITYEPTNPSYPGNATYNSSSGVCDPLEVVFNNVDLGDGVLKTITVTA